MKSGLIDRIVTLHGDRIVGDGALELNPPGWQEHIGELRIIVSNDFQRKGLGMILARELYFLAASRRLEKLIVRRMRHHQAAVHRLRQIGFREEVILPDSVKNMKGRTQELMVMSCDLEGMWKDREHYFGTSDLEYHL
jgi:ribosomal protein S18 acetylase RimI-like enzyme